MGIAVYQSGQAVQYSGWYEAVGQTGTLRTPTPATQPQTVVIKLKAGTAFPDWKGRAVCWRALAYSLVDAEPSKSTHEN